MYLTIVRLYRVIWGYMGLYGAIWGYVVFYRVTISRNEEAGACSEASE